MTVTIPTPSFLDKCELLGAFGGHRRWRSLDGKRLYTWDSLHGEIEVYNRRGRHLGAADALTGVLIKPARRERHIDV
jgi:Cytotoxic